MTRRILGFVLLLTLTGSALADDAQPLTALLLTARAELPDPYFRDSVVLVLNNIGPTPTGVILNRPTEIDIARLFPALGHLAQHGAKVYFGGPVGVVSVTFLFRSETQPSEHVVRILDGVYISTDLELLQKLLTRDKPMEGLRIFIGHASWGPGQLEAEIARGDWTIAPAEADTIFLDRPGSQWPAAPAGSRVHAGTSRQTVSRCVTSTRNGWVCGSVALSASRLCPVDGDAAGWSGATASGHGPTLPFLKGLRCSTR